jgi:archaellum biogenesis ATPase FlaH
MKERMENEVLSLPKDFVVLTIFPREAYQELNMHLLRILLKDKDKYGAYIAINKAPENLINIMDENKIAHQNLFFLDCVTQNAKEQSNCVYLGGPQSLTKIAIALEPVYKSQDHSFIFLDSLNALEAYHEPAKVIRFARSLIEQIREHKKTGVMIGLHEDTDHTIVSELSLVCDKVLDLT